MSQVVFLSHSFRFLMIIWRKNYFFTYILSCSCFFVELVVSDEILFISEEETALFNVISVFAASMSWKDYYICLFKGQSKKRIICVAILHLGGQFEKFFKSNLDHELLSLTFGWYSVQDVLLSIQCHLLLANLVSGQFIDFLIEQFYWDNGVNEIAYWWGSHNDFYIVCHLTIDQGPVTFWLIHLIT